jgi:hypothetical protein
MKQMMDQELKSKSKAKLYHRAPTLNLQIGSPTYSISVKATDPKGINNVQLRPSMRTKNMYHTQQEKMVIHITQLN